MRFQTKLLIISGLLLTMSLSAAGLAYWGVERSHFYLMRSRFAHEQLEQYLQLSRHTDRMFKEWTRALLSGSPDRPFGALKIDETILTDLRNIRSAIARELSVVPTWEFAEEETELARVDRIEAQIRSTLTTLESVETMARAGDRDGAWRALSAHLSSNSDATLNAMIESAVQDEMQEVSTTDARAVELLTRLERVSQAHAVLAVLLTIGFTVLLLQQMRRPLGALLDGTRALAAGDLGHRIDIAGRDEFAYLGQSFNRMADDLQSQRATIETAQARLETAVADRTEELRRANATLRKADSERRAFFADISHELRTPLTIMRGEGEIALRGQDKSVPEYKESMRRIVDQARHTALLVNDLLFIARHGAGEAKLDLRPVALNDVMEDLSADARIMAHERQVSVRFRRADQGLVVIGDSARLRQLFLILVDNAVRYSHSKGRVTLTLSAGEGKAVVTIADTGIGIAEEELDNVFERFRRGGNAIQHDSQGLGLGLPMAKAIAEAHGGSIRVTSRLHEGTSVTVNLPTVAIDASAAA
jgi:two-component system OmpR family sensor kinase